MRRNLTYTLLVLFMLFLVTANPTGTGENGRAFFSWLSSGWDDTREFVGSLMGDSEGDAERNELGEVVIPTVGPIAPAAVVPTPLPTLTPTPPPPPGPTAASQLGVVE